MSKKNSRPWHLFVLGPSGTGKTQIGTHLGARRNYLHIEIDRWPEGDGIDLENLRPAWDEFFLHGSATNLSATLTLRASAARMIGCVLTFPSGLLLSPVHIEQAGACNIVVLYLYGSAADCIKSFLLREQQNGRNLPVEHWLV